MLAKIYLDTNMILDIFLAQGKAFKEGTPFEQPRKFAFLVSHTGATEVITSFLTKAEVMRELLSAYAFTVPEAETMWNDFLRSLPHHRYIDRFTFDSTLVDIVCRVRLKLRTMLNFLHVFIAMAEGAYFVTGDKDILVKLQQNSIYDKGLDYVGLRRLLGGSSSQGGGQSS